MPNKAVKCGSFARKEEVRSFPHRHIEFVKSPDRHVLRSNRKMREAFRVQYRDSFACCPDLLVQEFRSYLADFPHFREAEVASCDGLVLNVKSVMR